MLSRVGFSIALCLAAAGACRADTVGPLTFGNNFPFKSDGPVPGGNVIPLVAPGVSFSSLNGSLFFDYTTTFSFDEAPGWTITNMKLTNFLDYGGPQIVNPDFTDWGFAFAEKVILCPTTGVCSTATTEERIHAAGLPQLSLGSDALAGTGVYEISGYVRNQQISTNGGLQNLNIFTALTPEPAPIVMLITGVVGVPLFRLARRRRKNVLDASSEHEG